MPGPGGHHGGPGGFGGPGGHHRGPGGFGGPGRPPRGGHFGGFGGHRPPPPPPHGGWGHRPYRGGCCGCLLPILAIALALVGGLLMWIF